MEQEDGLEGGEEGITRAPPNTVVGEERGGAQTPPTDFPLNIEKRVLSQKLLTEYTRYKAKGALAGSVDRAAVLLEGGNQMTVDMNNPLSSLPECDTTGDGEDSMVEQHQSTSSEADVVQLMGLGENRLVEKDVMTAPSTNRSDSRIEEEDIQGGTSIQNTGLQLKDEGMIDTTLMSNEEMMCGDDKVMMKSMNTENEDDDKLMTQCVHKRGMCVIHKFKGKKITVKHKRWGKVKTGYGWIHSQTVRYTCPMDSCPTGQKSF